MGLRIYVPDRSTVVQKTTVQIKETCDKIVCILKPADKKQHLKNLVFVLLKGKYFAVRHVRLKVLFNPVIKF